MHMPIWLDCAACFTVSLQLCFSGHTCAAILLLLSPHLAKVIVLFRAMVGSSRTGFGRFFCSQFGCRPEHTSGKVTTTCSSVQGPSQSTRWGTGGVHTSPAAGGAGLGGSSAKGCRRPGGQGRVRAGVRVSSAKQSGRHSSHGRVPALRAGVGESSAEHSRRHGGHGQEATCGCCRFQHRRRLLESYGSHAEQTSGERVVRITWLAERPQSMGGEWGVGCTCCTRWMAHMRAQRQHFGVVSPSKRRGPRFGDTKWARFEVRSVEQIAPRGVSQHAGTRCTSSPRRLFSAPTV